MTLPTARWLALGLAITVLASQTLAQQHLHAVDEPVSSCAACSHVDDAPLALSAVALDPQTNFTSALPPAEPRAALAAAAQPYIARAPPRS